MTERLKERREERTHLPLAAGGGVPSGRVIPRGWKVQLREEGRRQDGEGWAVVGMNAAASREGRGVPRATTFSIRLGRRSGLNELVQAHLLVSPGGRHRDRHWLQ